MDGSIDEGLARRLLEEQHPDLAALPLHRASVGSCNAIFRLGDQLAVRLPLHERAGASAGIEQTWLPWLSFRLTLPVPTPVRCGLPGRGYPWKWSVCPWLAGGTAIDVPVHEPLVVETMGPFLRSLHQPAPSSAPVQPNRGGPLVDQDGRFRSRLVRLCPPSLIRAITRVWEEALEARPNSGLSWVHGDLHLANILVRGGRPVAVLDFGDLSVGDPSVDMSLIWSLAHVEDRERLW